MANKIAVISDVHSNALALDVVLSRVLMEKVDLTVFLGDFLTYGAEPIEVLNKVLDYSLYHKSIFIKGNHDDFYIDIQNGQEFEKYKLPDFVRESVLWTADKINELDYTSFFDWKENFQLSDIYFSHANPFPYPDWSYIEKETSLISAFQALLEKGIRIGVFGHSHRKFEVYSNDLEAFSDKELDLVILNPGSIGQARGDGYSFLLINCDSKKYSFDFVDVSYDIDMAVSKIISTSLSDITKNKLISYLKGDV